MVTSPDLDGSVAACCLYELRIEQPVWASIHRLMGQDEHDRPAGFDGVLAVVDRPRYGSCLKTQHDLSIANSGWQAGCRRAGPQVGDVALIQASALAFRSSSRSRF